MSKKETYNHYSLELMQLVKKRVNFNLDEDVYLQVKQLALDKKTTATALYTKWIMEAIEKETGQTRFDVE